MADQVIYAGPGKLKLGSLVLHAEGPGGRIIARHLDEASPSESSLHGTLKKHARDLYAEVDITPYDDWSMLQYLLPFAACSFGGVAGTLTKGANPHGAVKVPLALWRADGQLYTYARGAVTGHPTLHLGVDRALFGGVKITCLGDLAKTRDEAGFLLSSVVESAGSEPAGNYDPVNELRGNWIGTFGDLTIEAEQEWTISPEIGYNAHRSQGLLKKMTLANVSFSISCRPVGPTHTQLKALVEANALGAELADDTDDLVLTHSSGTTITMVKPRLTAGGHEAGGSDLGTGEIVFHASLPMSAGAVQPVLQFSAVGGDPET